MRILIYLLLFSLIPSFLQAQERLSYGKAVALAPNDSMKFVISQEAAYYFVELNRDSLLHYVNLCIDLAQKNGEELEEGWGYASRGYCLTGMGEYSQAFASLLKAFALIEDPKNEDQKWLPPGQTGRHHRLYYLSYTHHLYAILMEAVRNYEQAIFHFSEGKRIAMDINVPRGVIWANMNLGFSYTVINKLDSARLFTEQAKELALQTPGEKKYLAEMTSTLGRISLKQGDTAKAKQFFHESIREAEEQKNHIALINTYENLTTLYFDEHEKDSAYWYARKAFEHMQTIGSFINRGSIYKNLYQIYLAKNQPDSALKYAELALVTKDSIANREITSLAEFQKMSLGEQLRLQNLEKEKITYQSRVRTNAMLAGLGIFLLIAAILYRNNRKKQQANKTLEQALTNLKATQVQLIQSEKMASLGELTAGIAHEIQNPLNFVNNFSEINTELIDELKKELADSSKQWAAGSKQLVEELIDDVKANEEKINHHGKRADGIVKGMLQHSRSSSGVKEPTDINALCDEYLRLSYHGLRAKDKSFNAKFETDFDSSLPKVSVVPQDIGRVILNLINNAFYAVTEKSKQQPNNYEPTVSVSTRRSGDKVLISIKDNGNGIPENIKEKIFQPFFTTKPTGQGTGLGLSLSYDIVKTHGGELRVETKERDGLPTGQAGSEFIIQLRTI